MTRALTVYSIALTAAVLAGCARQHAASMSPIVRDGGAQQLVFLTRDGCPASPAMRANVDAALRTLGKSADYTVINLGELSELDPRSGYPTPTVLYASRDIFGLPEPPAPHPPAT